MPALCTATVALSALPQFFSSPSPAALPSVRSPRQASDGLHGVVGTPSLPVWLLGDPPPAAPLGILVPLDDLTPRRMAAALRLWQALNGRSGRERGITRVQRRQLILRLRALDGHADGAALRDLARGLFGADHVPDGPAWKTHDLRSRTLRLLATARALRDGGYRELLTAGPSVRL
ncbi:MAG: DUF2285 domain-containing protein [Acetobacteraceae bacterium]|nr:DUF2285 domain-containing protein [Acetobacteraceae bacterium]